QFWSQQGRPKKRRFHALSDAFQGEMLGATAIGGVEVFRRPFAGSVMECLHVVASRGGDAGACEALERPVRDPREETAALVVEPPRQGAGGMKRYSERWRQAAREWTRQHQVHLVVDEVFTGYGRTGTMWACDRAGITPDILCIGKGFTGGILPMAATLTDDEMFAGFLGDDSRALFYGHTYCGHPLGAAIAREVLSVYRDEDVIARSQS